MALDLALAVATVPIAALLVDRAFGELPVGAHPVVWMGNLLAAVGRRLPSLPRGRAFASGALGWSFGALLVFVVASLLQEWVLGALLGPSPAWTSLLVWMLGTAFLLKPMLSLRFLLEEVLAVETALGESLEAGRARTARLCSRDTASLDAVSLRETAIESAAENLVDSVVAPLLWFAIAGLPGAALYRWANTADAMWGYRDPAREWSGKFAARADDVLSWLPARVAPLLLGAWGGGDRLRREARRTPSPNGGWPMAATALLLGVRLGKPGVYVLNAGACRAGEGDVARAVALVRRAAWRSAWAAGALAGLVTAVTSGVTSGS